MWGWFEMNVLLTFFIGLIFGVGLLLSGMVNPAKVQGFLDIFGTWDPSLALVMVGAIAVASPAFFYLRRRHHTLLGTALHLPAAKKIDRRLLIGSAAFGIGWGLAGFCPGPAVVALSASFLSGGLAKAWGFVAAMLLGMALFEVTQKNPHKS